MKRWEDNTSFLLVWTKGFEYEASLESKKTSEELVSNIKQFYKFKHLEEEAPKFLKYSGGYRWVSKYLSWIFLGPESCFYHTIQVNILPNNKINILYQARAYSTLLMHKISFQKEIDELRAIL